MSDDQLKQIKKELHEHLGDGYFVQVNLRKPLFDGINIEISCLVHLNVAIFVPNDYVVNTFDLAEAVKKSIEIYRSTYTYTNLREFAMICDRYFPFTHMFKSASERIGNERGMYKRLI